MRQLKFYPIVYLGLAMLFIPASLNAKEVRPIDLLKIQGEPLAPETSDADWKDVMAEQAEPVFYEGDEIDEEDSAFIENEYPDTKVFFEVMRGDGSSEVVGVPPNSILGVPADVLDIQYHHEEKIDIEQDIPSFRLSLTELDEVEEPDFGPDYILFERPRDRSNEPVEDLGGNGSLESETVVETYDGPPVKMVNRGDRLSIVHVMTRVKRHHIIIAHPNEIFELPPGTELIGVRPYKRSVSKRKFREQPDIHVTKSNGELIRITNIGKWEKVA